LLFQIKKIDALELSIILSAPFAARFLGVNLNILKCKNLSFRASSFYMITC